MKMKALLSWKASTQKKVVIESEYEEGYLLRLYDRYYPEEYPEIDKVDSYDIIEELKEDIKIYDFRILYIDKSIISGLMEEIEEYIESEDKKELIDYLLKYC